MNSELMHNSGYCCNKILNYNNLLKSASKENCVANRSSVYPVNAHKKSRARLVPQVETVMPKI